MTLGSTAGSVCVCGRNSVNLQHVNMSRWNEWTAMSRYIFHSLLPPLVIIDYKGQVCKVYRENVAEMGYITHNYVFISV